MSNLNINPVLQLEVQDTDIVPIDLGILDLATQELIELQTADLSITGGPGIRSITEVASTEQEGLNIITFELTNGQKYQVGIKDGQSVDVESYIKDSIDESSTDNQIPSAKITYEETRSAVQITWQELKDLRDEEGLKPGKLYRITDYQCVTSQEGTRSANHQFDIIVRADSNSSLNENAFAALHEDDDYFSLEYLESWSLKYSLDNDASRFLWADELNGKGVIYYMKDNYGNECDYDFKNIQFLRDEEYNTKCTFDDYTIDPYGTVSYGLTVPDFYYYTFSFIDSDNNLADMSCVYSIVLKYKTLEHLSCQDNSVLAYSQNQEKGVMSLSSNIFVYNMKGTTNQASICNNIIHGYNNTFGGRNIVDNYLSQFCYNNFFADYGYTQMNNIQGTMREVFIGGQFVQNNVTGSVYSCTFKREFQNNTISGKAEGLVIPYVSSNTISGSFVSSQASIASHNVILGTASSIISTSDVTYNTISGFVRVLKVISGLNYNMIAGVVTNVISTSSINYAIINGYFQNNKLYNAFGQSIINHNFCNCTINQKFLNNSVDCDFLNNTIDCYFRNCHFGHKIQYIHFNGNDTQVNNYNFSNGIHGTSDSLLEITPLTGQTNERTIAQNSNGDVVDYCMADLVGLIK